MPADDMPVRCPWSYAGTAEPDPVHIRYHDEEWGLPLHHDAALFELLILEGAQAGLNWRMVLHKRPGYRAAFCGAGAEIMDPPIMDPAVVVLLTEADQERLRMDPRIIRNRQKIKAAVGNARSFLAIQERFGSFDAYLWRFVDGQPKQNAWTEPFQVPVRTAESDALSKDLLERGFKFVGTTIVYAYMQAAGLVNDHLVSCFRHAELSSAISSRGSKAR